MWASLKSTNLISNQLKSRVLTAFVAASAVFCASIVQAQGTPLVTGQTLFPAPGALSPTGGIVIASLVQPYNAGTFSGILTSDVISGDPSNLLGGLTFTYVVSNDPTSQNVNARMAANGYTGWLTDVNYQLPPSGVVPTYIDRQVTDVVGFSFLGPPVGPGAIQPGQFSSLLVVQTNAPTYTNSFVSVIDGTNATIPSYGPAPEPTTIALLGLVGMAMIRRRR